MLFRMATWLGLGLLCLGLSAGSASAQLIEKKSLSLAAAKKIAAAAEAEAVKNKWTMTFTVLDEGGNTILVERMDGAQLSSVEASHGKALTAMRYKRPSKQFEDQIAGGRTAVVTLPGITAVQGGVPVVVNGQVVGAVGAAGERAPQDEQCSQAGIDALGLK